MMQLNYPYTIIFQVIVSMALTWTNSKALVLVLVTPLALTMLSLVSQICLAKSL